MRVLFRSVEEQRGQRVAAPALFRARIYSGEAVKAALDGTKQAVQRGGAPFVEREEPEPHRLRERDEDGDEKEDQGPAGSGHRRVPINNPRAAAGRRAASRKERRGGRRQESDRKRGR